MSLRPLLEGSKVYVVISDDRPSTSQLLILLPLLSSLPFNDRWPILYDFHCSPPYLPTGSLPDRGNRLRQQHTTAEGVKCDCDTRMSYSWIGAPTAFNGSNVDTGGDSGKNARFSKRPFAPTLSTCFVVISDCSPQHVTKPKQG